MTYTLRSLLRPVLGLACAALLLPGGLPGRALAGGSHAPIVLAQDDPDNQQDPSSAAALLVRVDRLENKLRSLTGQIEQLQFRTSGSKTPCARCSRTSTSASRT